MAHTDKDEILAQAIQALIEANKVTLGLDDVFYGNHNMIPRASAAIVAPLGKTRELAGVSAPGGRTNNTLMVSIDVHRSKVVDEETGRLAVDSTASAIEALLHTDPTIGGLIIHGFVQNVQRGETQFFSNVGSGSLFRSVQMVFSGTTKTYLSPPMAPTP